jgi:hypothetical protein
MPSRVHRDFEQHAARIGWQTFAADLARLVQLFFVRFPENEQRAIDHAMRLLQQRVAIEVRTVSLFGLQLLELHITQHLAAQIREHAIDAAHCVTHVITDRRHVAGAPPDLLG